MLRHAEGQPKSACNTIKNRLMVDVFRQHFYENFKTHLNKSKTNQKPSVAFSPSFFRPVKRTSRLSRFRIGSSAGQDPREWQALMQNSAITQWARKAILEKAMAAGGGGCLVGGGLVTSVFEGVCLEMSLR